MNILNHIQGLIQQAIKSKLIDKQDEIYVRNQIAYLLHISAFPSKGIEGTNDTIPNILEYLIDYAIQEYVIEDTFDEKEILAAQIMNCFVPHPSIVNHNFNLNYKGSPKEATDYFYNLSKNSNYIQMNRIAKNIQYKTDTVYGELDITINLSKPEKDPEQIKRERELKQTLDYPQCLLCRENEGYAGRIGYPARSNHRVIHIPLDGESWYLQYSPYVYYKEHSILFCEEHRNMKINQKTFQRLLLFVQKFPHYFIGSNADLPIVGGSILSHDHYQAGRYEFAMTKATNDFSFTLKGFPSISASTLNWPMSVIRLRGKDMQEMVLGAKHILDHWKQYQDKDNNIIPFTNDIPHHTITPIARMRESQFELDLVLRDNRTTKEYPLGIFHPHEDVQHIKKENIGLIEVMGLAVLPARLVDELREIEAFLVNGNQTVKEYHRDWANELKEKHGTSLHPDEAKDIVQQALGHKFARVLEDAGVFKQTVAGKRAFKKFIDTLNRN